MIGSRFISDKAVKSALTGQETFPAKLNASLAESLGLPKDIVVDSLTRVVTKGVGATQCRPYIMHFNNGEKLFLKLSPKMKDAVAQQRIADENIRRVFGGESHPFICMSHSSAASESRTHNELLFFPYVPGDNLFVTTTYRNKNKDMEKNQFEEIGKCLGAMHINCMLLNKTYDQFVAAEGLLQPVLVHDDWQSTNIMITPENKAIIIDTEGTAVSKEAYRNLADSWELTGKNPELMQALLQGYVREFPAGLQQKIESHIHAALTEKYHLDITSSAASSSPKYI